MSVVEYGAGAIFQTIAVLLAVARFRREFTQRIGALFISVAVLYHGVGEILLWLVPGRNIYRLRIPEAAESQFFVEVSVAILVFSICYVSTSGRYDQDNRLPLRRKESMAFLHWVPLILIFMPLLAITLSGQGATAAGTFGDESGERGGLQVLVSQLLVPIAVVLCVALMTRFKRTGLVLGIIAMLAAATASGQRNELLVAGVLFIYLATTFSTLEVRARSIIPLLAVGLGAFVVLTAVREESGRDTFAQDSGAGARSAGFIEGLRSLGQTNHTDAILDTLGYRLDGNSYGAMVADSIASGTVPLGWDELLISIRLAIPAALFPGKESLAIWERVPKLNAQRHFGLIEQDMLQTQLGSVYGWFGFFGMFVFAAALGFVLAALERKCMTSVSPAVIVLLFGVLYSLVQYGRGIEAWTTTLRYLIFIVPVVAIAWRTKMGHPKWDKGGKRSENSGQRMPN